MWSHWMILPMTGRTVSALTPGSPSPVAIINYEVQTGIAHTTRLEPSFMLIAIKLPNTCRNHNGKSRHSFPKRTGDRPLMAV